MDLLTLLYEDGLSLISPVFSTVPPLVICLIDWPWAHLMTDRQTDTQWMLYFWISDFKITQHLLCNHKCSECAKIQVKSTCEQTSLCPVPVPGIHLLHSDWSAGCRWSRQGVASFQGCCYSKGVLLTPPLLLSMVTPPCLIPWGKTCFDHESQYCLFVLVLGNIYTLGCVLDLPWTPHLSCVEDSLLEGHCRYCWKRRSKAWPMVLMTSWARPSEHSRMWHADEDQRNTF